MHEFHTYKTTCIPLGLMAMQVKYLCLHDAYVMDRDRRLVPWLAKRGFRHGLTAGCELDGESGQDQPVR